VSVTLHGEVVAMKRHPKLSRAGVLFAAVGAANPRERPSVPLAEPRA
jgi:hypothetical protein